MASSAVEHAIAGYYARAGSGITDEVAEELGPELERVQHLDAREVVGLAQKEPEQLPVIHRELLWDDAECGERYRQQQVTHFRNAVEVIWVTREGQEKRERAFFSIPATLLDPKDSRRDRRGHPVRLGVTVDRVYKEELLRQHVVGEARRAFIQMRYRYDNLRELLESEDPDFKAVFESLEQLEGNGHDQEAPTITPTAEENRERNGEE